MTKHLTTILVCLFFLSCNKDELIRQKDDEKYSIANKKADQPPSSENVRERFYAIVKEKLVLDDTDLVPEASLVNDLGADELDKIEIIMAAKAEFLIEIEDDEAEKLITLDQFVKFIYSRLQTVVITPGGGGGTTDPPIVIPNPGGGTGNPGGGGGPGGGTVGGGGPTPQYCAGLNAIIIPILKSGESYQCATPNESFATFSSASAFAEYIDSPISYSDTYEAQSSTEKILRLSALTASFPKMGEEFFVKLRKNSGSTLWEVIDVTSADWGFPIFTEWEQLAWTVSVSNNVSKVEVMGRRSFNIILEGIGTIYRQERKYRITVDNVSGTKISFIKI